MYYILNKTVKIAIGATLTLGVFSAGLFSSSVFTKATTDWKTDAINAANSSLGSTGYTEKEKLKASATTDINATVQGAIGDDVEAQKAELQKMLNDYYNLKLAGMTETQSFKDLEIQIKGIQKSIYDRYTKELDAVFATQAQ
jgi:hypothetical protein